MIKIDIVESGQSLALSNLRGERAMLNVCKYQSNSFDSISEAGISLRVLGHIMTSFLEIVVHFMTHLTCNFERDHALLDHLGSDIIVTSHGLSCLDR